ncbi:MAG: hypothetical protein HW421_3874 [Ignavibacteria bacterium]|nr:hypothetical protein [Ignavibacteria bacterium]
MHIAILSAESESDFNIIIELSKKLNFRTKVLSGNESEINWLQMANESALIEWLTPEEDEVWKNL